MLGTEVLGTSEALCYPDSLMTQVAEQRREPRLRKVNFLKPHNRPVAESGLKPWPLWVQQPRSRADAQTRKQREAAATPCQAECKNWKCNTLLREEGDRCGLGQGGMFPLEHVTAGLLGTGTGNRVTQMPSLPLRVFVFFRESGQTEKRIWNFKKSTG